MEIQPLLIAWYHEHKRDLRWRESSDPYRIWLSETILQQTRVSQGAAYYDRFIEQYPTVEALAMAPEDEVLKLWQGLGYYARARNLHAAARQVVERFEGRFPDEYEALRSLPGVGDYTASAVSSIAANRPHAVVDGNVYRLYARLFDIETPIDTSAGQKAFKALATELLPVHDAANYNQAVMEFGALCCTPKSPRCGECPLEAMCQARAHGTIPLRPQKQGRIRMRDRYFHYLHLHDKAGHTLIHKRTGRDIWQGLYDFPLWEQEQPLGIEQLPLKAQFRIEHFTLKGEHHASPHQLSHQRIYARFFNLEVEQLPEIEGCICISESDLGNYAVPRLVERYLDQR